MPELISHVECCDNMEFMAKFPDKFFDLAIIDPPYGINRDGYECGSKANESWRNPTKKVYQKKEWDKFTPQDNYFIELFRVSKNQTIWGGNYFIDNLYSSMCCIVWDKEVNGKFSEFEFAWTSFQERSRLFRWMWNGYRKQKPEIRIHPTQKPVALYSWILKNYAKQNDKILDTHLGSQSSRIAAYKLGFDFWGCEIDEDYFRDGCVRFEKECHGIIEQKNDIKVQQQKLFI